MYVDQMVAAQDLVRRAMAGGEQGEGEAQSRNDLRGRQAVSVHLHLSVRRGAYRTLHVDMATRLGHKGRGRCGLLIDTNVPVRLRRDARRGADAGSGVVLHRHVTLGRGSRLDLRVRLGFGVCFDCGSCAHMSAGVGFRGRITFLHCLARLRAVRIPGERGRSQEPRSGKHQPCQA